jgi:hypothetical protein
MFVVHQLLLVVILVDTVRIRIVANFPAFSSRPPSASASSMSITDIYAPSSRLSILRQPVFPGTTIPVRWMKRSLS